MFSFFNKSIAENSGVAYDYKFNSIDGGQINLNDYKDKVIVVVNVASRCGYTPQYEDLQTLYDEYKSRGLIIIGVPTNNFKQEPGTNNQIKDFCETNFGIALIPKSSFAHLKKGCESVPITLIFSVIGKVIPKWNFHKIIIGKNGKIQDTFASFTKPTSKKFIKLIEKLI